LSERGDLSAAELTIDDAAALANVLPAGSFDAYGLTLRRARVELLRGQPAAARDLVQPLIEPPEARPNASSSLAGALRLRADALNQLGESKPPWRDGQAALTISQQLQGGRRYSLPSGQAWLLLARVKREAGDLPGSRARRRPRGRTSGRDARRWPSRPATRTYARVRVITFADVGTHHLPNMRASRPEIS